MWVLRGGTGGLHWTCGAARGQGSQKRPCGRWCLSPMQRLSEAGWVGGQGPLVHWGADKDHSWGQERKTGGVRGQPTGWVSSSFQKEISTVNTSGNISTHRASRIGAWGRSGPPVCKKPRAIERHHHPLLKCPSGEQGGRGFEAFHGESQSVTSMAKQRGQRFS